MWQVIVRNKGKETFRGEAKHWGDAYAEYRSQALLIDAVNSDGAYLYPNKRVSIGPREI